MIDNNCAFLFDMDEVAVDNAEFHYNACQELYRQESHSYKMGESRCSFGRTNSEF